MSVQELGLSIAGARRFEATVNLDANPRERRADLVLQKVTAESGEHLEVTADEISAEMGPLEEGRPIVDMFPLDLQVRGMGAKVTEKISIAGADGWVSVSDPAAQFLAFELKGTFSDRSHDNDGAKVWSADGRFRRDLSEGSINISVDEFELGRVPQLLRQLPVVSSEHAVVGGSLSLSFQQRKAHITASLRLDGLNIDHPRLARSVVHDFGFGLELTTQIDLDAHRVLLENAVLSRRGVELHAHGEIVHPPAREQRRYTIALRIPSVSCQRLIEAIPPELIPGLRGMKLQGSFDAHLDVAIDMSNLEALGLGGKIGAWGCQASHAPRLATPQHLAGPFLHRVNMVDGRVAEVRMGGASGSFTPLWQISPHMISAVLTTEDGGFWRHRGFLPSQFKVALRRNLAADEVELGASTITMQMVKNVLLSHERTLARKFQEVILTWHVENVLPKERIMEIYLNAIEYGPGLYGITAAARHYFAKHPSELNPLEAVYLALMLPSPVRRYAQYCYPQLTSGFQTKVDRILRIMHERGRLADIDYAYWQGQSLSFNPDFRQNEAECLARSQKMRAGQETQRALSGLLSESPDVRLAAWDEESRNQEDPSNVDAPGTPELDDARP
jgi:hypothetical protein